MLSCWSLNFVDRIFWSIDRAFTVWKWCYGGSDQSFHLKWSFRYRFVSMCFYWTWAALRTHLRLRTWAYHWHVQDIQTASIIFPSSILYYLFVFLLVWVWTLWTYSQTILSTWSVSIRSYHRWYFWRWRWLRWWIASRGIIIAQFCRLIGLLGRVRAIGGFCRLRICF